jgi:hypothetical protein
MNSYCMEFTYKLHLSTRMSRSTTYRRKGIAFVGKASVQVVEWRGFRRPGACSPACRETLKSLGKAGVKAYPAGANSPMKKSDAAATSDAYVATLVGWRRDLVEQLRSAVLAAAKLEEVVKWRHLVYLSNGPALLIRAEAERVLFGFWRGQRLGPSSPASSRAGSTRWPR